VAHDGQGIKRAALGGVVVAVVLVIGLLLANIIGHALHKTTTTYVTTEVLSVVPLSDSQVAIHVAVTSDAAVDAQVSCLVGVERPAMPLAYPTRTAVHLTPGQRVTFVVDRHLLKPVAAEVDVADVAFTCT
jgi:hypothetical protein